MDDNDKYIIEVILQMRLSEEAGLSVSSCTSTQRIEAFNRAAVSTLSKVTNVSQKFLKKSYNFKIKKVGK